MRCVPGQTKYSLSTQMISAGPKLLYAPMLYASHRKRADISYVVFPLYAVLLCLALAPSIALLSPVGVLDSCRSVLFCWYCPLQAEAGV